MRTSLLLLLCIQSSEAFIGKIIGGTIKGVKTTTTVVRSAGDDAAQFAGTGRVAYMVKNWEKSSELAANPALNKLGRAEYSLKPLYGGPVRTEPADSFSTVALPLKTSDGSTKTISQTTYTYPRKPTEPADTLYFGGRPPRGKDGKIMKFQGHKTNEVEKRTRGKGYAMKWQEFSKSSAGEQALFGFLLALDVATGFFLAVFVFFIFELLDYLSVPSSSCIPEHLPIGKTCEGYNEAHREPFPIECIDKCGYDCKSGYDIENQCREEPKAFVGVVADIFSAFGQVATGDVIYELNVINPVCRPCFHHQEDCEPPLPYRQYTGSGCVKDNDGRWQCSSLCPQKCDNEFIPKVTENDIVICCVDCQKNCNDPNGCYTDGCSIQPSYLNVTEQDDEYQLYLLGSENPGFCTSCSKCMDLHDSGWRIIQACTSFTNDICVPCTGLPENAVWPRNFYGNEPCVWECKVDYYRFGDKCLFYCTGNKYPITYEDFYGFSYNICCERCLPNQYIKNHCSKYHSLDGLTLLGEAPTICCNQCPVGKYKVAPCNSHNGESVCADCTNKPRNSYYVYHEFQECFFLCDYDTSLMSVSYNISTGQSFMVCCKNCALGEYMKQRCTETLDTVCDKCVYGTVEPVRKKSISDNMCNAYCSPPKILSFYLSLEYITQSKPFKNAYCCNPPTENHYIVSHCNDTHTNMELPCTVCPIGTYIHFACTRFQDTTCYPCGTGLISIPSQTTCFACPTGKVKISPDSCARSCAMGGFQVGGSYQNLCNDSCIYPGVVVGSGFSASCEFCEAGEYHITSSSTGVLFCATCSSGTYQNLRGKTQCNTCSVCSPAQGNYELQSCTTTSNTVCVPCPAMPVCSVHGHVTGVCPSFSCVCNTGYFGNGYLCQPCSTCDNPVQACTAYEDTKCDCGVGYNYYMEDGRKKCRQCETCLFGESFIPCDGTQLEQQLQCVCPVGFKRLDYYDCLSCQYCDGLNMNGKYTIIPDSRSQCLKGVLGTLHCSCNQGYVFSIFYHTCSICPSAGLEAVNDVCSSCAMGKFKSYASSEMCRSCPYGSYTLNQYYKTACQSCEPGTFNVLLSSSECSMCATGTYQDRSGGYSCNYCDVGLYPYNASNATCSYAPDGNTYCFDNVTTEGVYTCPAGFLYHTDYTMGEKKSWIINVSNAMLLSITFKTDFLDTEITTSQGLDFLSIYPCEKKDLCEPVIFSGTYISNGYLNDFNIDNLIFISNILLIEWTSLTANIGWSFRWSADVPPFHPCNPGYFLDANQCLPCPPGFFSNVSASMSCFGCELGKYQDLNASTDCKQCPSGSYQYRPANSFCINCIPGFYTNDKISCQECSIGKFSVGNATYCEVCPEGKYSMLTQTIACQPCTECHVNASGSICLPYQNRYCKCKKPFKGDGVDCTLCPENTMWYEYDIVSTWCKYCEIGEYLPDCNSCPIGKAQYSFVATHCFDCIPGSFQNSEKSALCIPCPKGRFQSQYMATQCYKCDNFSYSVTTNQTVCLQCSRNSYFCNNEINRNTSGNIIVNCSQGYIDKRQYKNNEQLNVSISITNASQITIEFLKYSQYTNDIYFLSFWSEKNHDFLLIYNCSQTIPSCLQLNLSGSWNNIIDIQNYITFKTNTLTLVWFTDSDTTYDGWHLNWFSDVPPCIPCETGKYSAPGATSCAVSVTTSTTTTIPPTTTTVPPPTTSLISCPAGQYQNGSRCAACSPGSFKSSFGHSTSCTLCAPPTYNDYYGAESCIPCPYSTYNPSFGAASESECVPCDLGTRSYRGVVNKSDCEPCPAGFYGVYRGCQGCIQGKYQTGIGMTTSEVCQSCTPGSYSAMFAASTSGCLSCSPGTFSSGYAATVCTTCSTGSYNDVANATSCMLCTGENTSSFPFTECSLCLSTEYPCYQIYNTASTSRCGSGGIDVDPVELNTVMRWDILFNKDNQFGTIQFNFIIMPKTTTFSTYVNFFGYTNPKTCLEEYCYLSGYQFFFDNPQTLVIQNAYNVSIFFHTGYRDESKRLYFTWSSSSKACLACPPFKTKNLQTGQYCSVCEKGFLNIQDICVPCEKGFYCPDENTSIMCENNLWGNVTGSWSQESGCQLQCEQCDLGQWRSSCKGNSSGFCVDCAANSYGRGHDFFSPCTPCPAHSTSVQGSKYITDCKCPEMNQIFNNTCTNCSASMVKIADWCVCIEDTYGSFETGCSPCYNNSDSEVNTTSIEGCICRTNFLPPLCDKCVPGFYLEYGDCLPCPPGFFCADGVSPSPCKDGVWGDIWQTSTEQAGCPYECGTCPLGQWKYACEASNEGICLECPANSYGGGGGAITPCTPCPPNSTSSRGSISITQCVCPFGLRLVGALCETCPVHSILIGNECVCLENFYGPPCIPCPQNSNSSQNSASISSCICKPNHYRSADVCHPCPENSESLPGSVSVVQCACLPNFYRKLDACPACPMNSTSLRASLSVAACKCAADFYFSNDTCLPCPANSASPSASTSVNQCVCNLGFNKRGWNLCSPCPAGYTCPSQTQLVPCPAGTWGNITGQYEEDSACRYTCADCPFGAWKARCGVFNPGVCIKCPIGTYGAGPGATASSWCSPCPTGSTSVAGSASSSDCTCDRNFYGQAGLFCWPCPAHSTGVLGATNVLGCLCEADRYGPDQFAQCAACPPNSSSQAGSRSQEACVCVPGWYGPNGGACELCPPLWTCPGGNVSIPYVKPRLLVSIGLCCDVICTFPGSPATTFYPSSFTLQSFVLLYDDNTSMPVSLSDPNVKLVFDEVYLTLVGSAFSVRDVRTYPGGLLTTSINVTYADVFQQSVTVTITDVSELLVQTYFPEGLAADRRELHRFQCSDAYQWINVTCRARVNLPMILPIDSKCNLFVRNQSVARASGNTIVGVSPGTTSAFALWWGYTAEIASFDVVDDSISFTSILGEDYLFYGVVGETKRLAVTLEMTMPNGVTTRRVDDAITSEFGHMVILDMPPSVERRGNFIVSVSNSLRPEWILFSLPVCEGRRLTHNSTLIVNLSPAPGDVDVGELTWVAIPPTLTVLSIRVNLLGVLAFHAEFGCDFAITHCAVSPSWAGEAACTVHDPVGSVRVAGLSGNRSGVVEVAQISVTSVEGGLRGWVQSLGPVLSLTTVIAGRWSSSSYAPPSVPAMPLLDISTVYRAGGEGLLVLVRQQRLLFSSIAFSNERELSVLVRFVDRDGIADETRLRVFYLVNSTVELPFMGWFSVPHLREGWYGVEWKAAMPRGWANFSVALETFDDFSVTFPARRRVYGTISVPPFEYLNLSGVPFAHFQVGFPYSACPRDAETAAALSMSYAVRVSGTLSRTLSYMANELGCELGVPLRRVELDLSDSVMRITVRVESFLRLYEVNMFVMDEARLGIWLSIGGLFVVTVQRRGYVNIYDPPDANTVCPPGKFFYQGDYVSLPPHALPMDCYSFACEVGFHPMGKWCQQDTVTDQVYWNVMSLAVALLFVSALVALILRELYTLFTQKWATRPVVVEEEDPWLLPVDVTPTGDFVFAAEVVDEPCLLCYSCCGAGGDCPCRRDLGEDRPCCCRQEREEDAHCACCWTEEFNNETAHPVESICPESHGSDTPPDSASRDDRTQSDAP